MENEKITWIIGDIHGMYDALRTLVERLDDEHLDKFVFVGDYIDHGPSSKEVLDLIMRLGDKAISLIGNHEHLLLQTLFDEKFQDNWGNRIWEENGAESTVRSFGCRDIDEFAQKIDPKYIEFLKNLKCFHVETFQDESTEIKFLVTHGGVMPNIPLAEQLALNNYLDHNQLMDERNIWIEDSFLWIRSDFFKADPADWDGYVVIHGHSPTHLMGYTLRDFDLERDLDQKTQLYIRTHPDDEERIVSIDIDTGAAFGRRLTALGFKPSALQYGWFEVQIVQLDIQQGYYRTYPFIRERFSIQGFEIDNDSSESTD